MRRVAIVGSGGSGKSTLARRLGQLTGLLVVHLDRLYWRRGWVPTPTPEWEARLRDLTAGDAWILDGNHSATIGSRLARADTVIFLDVGRTLSLLRVLGRAIRYRGRERPDMAAGCPERVDREFLVWVWNYPVRSRGPLLAKLAEAERRGVTVHRLRTSREVRRFLRALAPTRRYMPK
jgi:adenylate kinase family enzyme